MTQPDEWMTLQQAARHLGLSTRTVRRWIKDGKLQAELRPGPYGRQYVVPASSLPSTVLIRQVEREERRENVASLAAALERYLAEREDRIAGELSTIRAEMSVIRNELDSLRALLEGQAE